MQAGLGGVGDAPSAEPRGPIALHNRSHDERSEQHAEEFLSIARLGEQRAIRRFSGFDSEKVCDARSVAQLAPSITGVVNAASSDPGIAADAWVTITGSNLANSSRS